MRLTLSIILGVTLFCPTAAAQSGSKRSWPHSIPARTRDGANIDLLVMTLGDVKTPLAEATFDPVKDEVRFNDGTVKSNYYKDTLRIKYFKPIDKSKFPLPPAGWCSWYFYYQEINSDEIERNARWIAENLKEHGAEVVQIDDGWQGVGHGQGDNRDWTTIDKRFSARGMNNLAAYIKSLGLTPGIWLAPHGQSNESIVKANPGVFMLKPDGTSVSSTWEGKFLVDPSTPESQKYLKDLFTTLSSWGYDYFKIDGQPIVTREYRNKKASMKNPQDDTDALYRDTLESIREAIGPDRYLLGCWVVPLEGVGLMDGSRIGADVLPNWEGFRFALRATMQYYFLHNVAWYADPDVLVVRPPLPLEQARAWATLQGLTGLAVLTSDRLTDLPQERVELLRRVYPAVDIRPLDLFSNERNKRIWDLKVNHLDRQYDVVGIFNFDEFKPAATYVSWKDLGLEPSKPVHVYDFWNREYLGAWENGISVEIPATSTRVLTLLPATDQPQLISTSRHLTQGWVDLVAQKYNPVRNAFTGRSRVIKDDPYELSFVFPKGKNFAIKSASARDAKGLLRVTKSNHQGWATIAVSPPRSGEITWDVTFEPAGLYRFPVKEPQNVWTERVGIDGVNLRWGSPHQPAAGYLVTLNGVELGFTPTQVFGLNRLAANTAYTAEVRTVWQDGVVSEKKSEIKFTLDSLLPDQVAISDLYPLRATPGWRQPELNRTFTGKGLSIKGRHYEVGIGLPTNSEIEFDVTGPYETFTALVGIDDEYNSSEGAVEFAVIADGKELWQSQPIKKADGATPVKVNIKGVRRLVLRAKRSGPEGGRIHANFVDARLLRHKSDKL